MKPSPYRNVPATNETGGSPNYSVRGVLREGISRLRDGKVPSFTLAAELLFLHVLGRDRAWLYAHPEELLSNADLQRFFGLVTRRTAGEPTQHLTGKQEFWGLEFEVTPDVLIPRPETEHVIEVALDRLALRELQAGRSNKSNGSGLHIADVGTGSGCIAVALAKELPAARIWALDISAAAIAVALRNAERNGVPERIEFLESNLLESPRASDALAQQAAPLRGASTSEPGPSFDLIVSNPPYVGRCEAGTLAREVRDHEPELALFGGEKGHELYGELIRQSAAHLKSSGILILELGYNSLPAVQPLLDAADWTNVGVTNDLAGIPRVIAAEKL